MGWARVDLVLPDLPTNSMSRAVLAADTALVAVAVASQVYEPESPVTVGLDRVNVAPDTPVVTRELAL